ncbi:aromatic ring-hydroxylating oxygenase subunit alpha [Candidatus Marimicrobium litorale]|uniref:Aromatic ring-hydroxylating dioxygenase subunit alpha n=1 Tax=Candidatus Marimicrobium litorale TaxID=2518991 RepID=A0ABT3T3E8_9GAMM|nr:aromatic ring-hydroxylating dioxygenase subunit alpha [Candidatus Marimicrobium litorale]MCX2976776.1 aromatic ring-hydroxylating dioxygenase subunit alpha [Candidatus Marimicrobium litorale]
MPKQQKPIPGQARASGPSVLDTLSADSIAPPDPLLDSQYEFLGDGDIPFERYTSESYRQREVRELWSRSWQWACREEHLPDVGDTYTYDIGPYSVIVVRSKPDTIQAFLNSCTHRGTRILGGQGSGYGAAFTCPFHGWSWELDGSIRNIPGRWDFPHVCNETHDLQAVNCQLWGGFVFINLDLDAKPLASYLDILPQHFQHFPLERRRIKVHVQKTLPANWKAAQEAFMEAYHNFETHDSPNGGNTQYDVFGKYVSRFIHNIGNYSPESLQDYPGDKWRRPALTEDEQLAFLSVFNLEYGAVPEGGSAREIAAQKLRDYFGESLGIDFSEVSECLMLDSIEYHLFPNMFFFAGINVPMVYRFRPNGEDVESSIFDLFILEPLSEGEPHPEPPEPHFLDVEQSYTEVKELGWLAPVYDEDTGNLDLQQKGFKTSRKTGLTLGNYQEARIRRVHLTLDEFMPETGE